MHVLISARNLRQISCKMERLPSQLGAVLEAGERPCVQQDNTVPAASDEDAPTLAGILDLQETSSPHEDHSWPIKSKENIKHFYFDYHLLFKLHQLVN